MLKRSARCFHPGVLLASVLLCFGLMGCKDDPPRITLENSWPNDEGRFWSFTMEAGAWTQGPEPGEIPGELFSSREEVPEVPSLTEAVMLLSEQLEGEPLIEEEGVYTLQFSGQVTTESGVTKQNLQATLQDAAPPVQLAARSPLGRGLLRQLALARPDLRPRLRSHLDDVESSPLQLLEFEPLILHGGAWEKTEQWIGTYGDLDQDLAWQYLDENLQPGHEFSLQLIKVLTDDVFLHARVDRVQTLETQVANFTGALRVVYLIDFGVSVQVDGNGMEIGYSRSFTLGSIVYAPSVGPIHNVERAIYSVGAEAPTGPWSEILLELRATGRIEL